MRHKIYVDLDGVMANFEKLVVETVGIHYWDRTTDKFWHRIDKVPNFYYKLELLPASLAMFNQILDVHGTDIVEVLTGAPLPTNELATSCQDKRDWFRDNVNPDVTVNTIEGGKNKYKFLADNPQAVLIDDYDRNIKAWIAHGGCGILHTDPPSTIAKLKLLGLL